MSNLRTQQATSSEAPRVVSRVRATEASRRLDQRVLDAIREFLEAHPMAGKTGGREFYEFEKALHERLLDQEREVLGIPVRLS